MAFWNSDKTANPVMGNFILAEIRDLRKGIESRDGELRGEISGVRAAVANLSDSVSRSQGHVETIKGTVDLIDKAIKVLRVDVDEIMRIDSVVHITKTAAWNGPKQILAVVGATGLFLSAVTAIIASYPIIGAWLASP